MAQYAAQAVQHCNQSRIGPPFFCRDQLSHSSISQRETVAIEGYHKGQPKPNQSSFQGSVLIISDLFKSDLWSVQHGWYNETICLNSTLTLEPMKSNPIHLTLNLGQSKIQLKWFKGSLTRALFSLSSEKTLKVPCHAFPVITRPLVCYEGFSACKRSAESKTLKVHPVASTTLTQSMLPQNASLEISHFPLFISWVLWCVNTQRPHPLPAFHETTLPKPFSDSCRICTA